VDSSDPFYKRAPHEVSDASRAEQCDAYLNLAINGSSGSPCKSVNRYCLRCL